MSRAALSQPPVRLVLFDVFDTLCTPRIPVHEQYAEEAHRNGIKSVTPDSVRAAFKPAFREMSRSFPVYGKHHSPPLTPEQWWMRLIHRCMVHAGAKENELAEHSDAVGHALLARFDSAVGYRNFPETLSALKGLRDLGVKTGIVSNSDPRILRTLDALDISPLLSCPPTLSWHVEAGKPDPTIFAAACRTCDIAQGHGVLMVGDELQADFHGALSAGIEGRLVRRPGEWSDGAIREAEEDLGDVNVVLSLTDVLDEVKRRNGHVA